MKDSGPRGRGADQASPAAARDESQVVLGGFPHPGGLTQHLARPGRQGQGGQQGQRGQAVSGHRGACREGQAAAREDLASGPCSAEPRWMPVSTEGAPGQQKPPGRAGDAELSRSGRGEKTRSSEALRKPSRIARSRRTDSENAKLAASWGQLREL